MVDRFAASQTGAAIIDEYNQVQERIAVGAFSEAQQRLENLLPQLEAVSDQLGKARILIHLAQLAELQAELEQAKAYFYQALQAASQVMDYSLAALAAQRLATLIRFDQPQAAHELLALAMGACEQIGDTVGCELIRATAGHFDCEQGQWERGLPCLVHSLAALPPESVEFEAVWQWLWEYRRQLAEKPHRELVEATLPDPFRRQLLLESGP